MTVLPQSPLGTFVNEEHAAISAWPIEGVIIKHAIPGWLQPVDALLLYEFAYKSDGPILELGTFHGLSTSILASALRARAATHAIDSVEVSASNCAQAARHLAAHMADGYVRLRCECASTFLQRAAIINAQYSFAFVDHSHSFEQVALACQYLMLIMKKGGYVMFHDYTDPRNTNNTGVGDDPNEFGVRHACDVALNHPDVEFIGVYGASGLFRFGQ